MLVPRVGELGVFAKLHLQVKITTYNSSCLELFKYQIGSTYINVAPLSQSLDLLGPNV